MRMTKNADFSLPVTRLGPFGTIIRVEGGVGTLPSRSKMNETGKTHSSKDFLRFQTVHTVTRAALNIKNHPNSLHPRLFHYADGSALEHFSYWWRAVS